MFLRIYEMRTCLEKLILFCKFLTITETFTCLRKQTLFPCCWEWVKCTPVMEHKHVLSALGMFIRHIYACYCPRVAVNEHVRLGDIKLAFLLLWMTMLSLGNWTCLYVTVNHHVWFGRINLYVTVSDYKHIIIFM